MKAPGYHLITFGCQMNVNDSAWLARALDAKGFQESSLEDAAVVFVNTCSVREKPEQKVYSTLGRVRQVNPQAVVGVAGCVAQQLGGGIMDRHPQVRLVTGSDGVVHAPEAFVRLMAEPELRLAFTDFTESYPDRDPYLAPDTCSRGSANPSVDGSAKAAPEKNGTAVTAAFVNIMQGCDNFCAYCIVPFTRGPRKSRSVASVLEECRGWVQAGAREITLLGQNVNVFGDDNIGPGGAELTRGLAFPRLLEQVAELEGVERIRFVSVHPRDFSDETIAVLAREPKICPRLHLPLQSGSDTVLKRMGRGYTMADFQRLVDRLRNARPGLALSTDLIVGFPGETEEEFEETLAALDAAGFMSSFSFCYSDRPGTRASAMPVKIPRDVQLKRLERLQNLQNERSDAWLASRVNLETDVLLECLSPRPMPGPEMTPSWQGRDPWGDVVHVMMDKTGDYTGKIVRVRIHAAKKHSLLASLS